MRAKVRRHSPLCLQEMLRRPENQESFLPSSASSQDSQDGDDVLRPGHQGGCDCERVRPEEDLDPVYGLVDLMREENPKSKGTRLRT